MRFTQTTPFARKEKTHLEAVDIIIKVAALIGALGGIIGGIYAVFKWFQKQEKQTTDIAALKELHEKDMEAARKKEAEDMKAIKDELCVLSYAMLASLDGLKQQGCNGEVTKAHAALEKHLNQKAHDQ
jgi:predicted negative regulator of RcsB-dependent stress response